VFQASSSVLLNLLTEEHEKYTEPSNVVDPNSMGSLDPDPVQDGKNDPTKIEKKVNKFHFLKCWIFFLRADGFSCIGNPLRRPRDELQFLIEKTKKIIFFRCTYFFNFWS
jgi:hypothetical protein